MFKVFGRTVSGGDERLIKDFARLWLSIVLGFTSLVNYHKHVLS